jgi:hypothetical protein
MVGCVELSPAFICVHYRRQQTGLLTAPRDKNEAPNCRVRGLQKSAGLAGLVTVRFRPTRIISSDSRITVEGRAANSPKRLRASTKAGGVLWDARMFDCSPSQCWGARSAHGIVVGMVRSIARCVRADYTLRIDMTKAKPKGQLQKRGRKSAFRPEYILIAKACARLGAIEEEIADELHINHATLDNWKKKTCSFAAPAHGRI